MIMRCLECKKIFLLQDSRQSGKKNICDDCNKEGKR